MKQVWIVQPYVPGYRVPFFEGLAESLGADGVELKVVAGRPSAAQAKRGDAERPPWLEEATDRKLTFAGRTATLTATRRFWRDADAVIVPHMGSSVDAVTAVAGRSRRRVGVWGHIAPYTSKANPLDLAVERWQLHRAHHVFAYTPGGAAYAERAGVSPTRITTVMNTVDTNRLRDELASIGPDEIAKFRSDHDLGSDRVVSYIGGLDASKRIDLLAESLDVLWADREPLRVLVGGDGEDAHLLDGAVARGQVVRMGIVGTRDKAYMGKVSTAIVCPGRIGLIAVEALTFGLPIVTTEWPYHAPEREYLVADRDVIYAENSPGAFAQAMFEVAGSEAHHASAAPQLADMVQNFRTGILTMLD